MKHFKNKNEFINESKLGALETYELKRDREKILNFIGHSNWNVVLRKLNTQSFSDFRYKFEESLRKIKLSLGFIEKYKDLKLFPSFIDNVLKNEEYSEEELINIIESYPDYIDWYNVFYNKKIPLWFKKENYDKIYKDSIDSYDNSVDIETREKNTKNALSILNESDNPFDDDFEKKWKEITEPKEKEEEPEPEIDEKLKSEIITYLEKEYTEDWFNEELGERAPDYVDEEELEEHEGDYGAAYTNYCNGGAIEYDLIDEITKEVEREFKVDWNTANYFVMKMFKKNCEWKDSGIF